MDVYRLPLDRNRIPSHARAVALGIFDGVHLGHRAVITQANTTQDCCAVYTFLPDTVTTKSTDSKLCPSETEGQLKTLGVRELFLADFAAVRDLSPDAFVRTVLRDTLHASTAVCGFNYRFGKDGVGDAALLTALCAQYGITVIVVPEVTVDGGAVSTTAIRRALSEGDMATVRRLLGRNYCLNLLVVDGQHLGRRLEMPTINQTLPADEALPRFGVYASCTVAAGRVYPSVTNIGRRPTVGADAPLAETHIIGFSGDLYGQTVAVYPLQYLRSERTFPDLNALRAQVAADIAAAKALHTAPDTPQIKAVIFDFDDTLGSRDSAFEQAVERFLRHNYPRITEDEFLRRKEDMILYNNYGYGMPVSYPKYVERYLGMWEPVEETAEDAYRMLFHDFATTYTLYSDTVETLKALRERGYKLGVLTNGWSTLQNQKLDHTGIRPLLDVVTVSGDHHVSKPDPEIFRRTAAWLGVPCECCLFVGDHPLNDVTGALNADMQAVWMDAGFPPEHPCLQYPLPAGVPTVTSLSQLLDLLPSSSG